MSGTVVTSFIHTYLKSHNEKTKGLTVRSPQVTYRVTDGAGFSLRLISKGELFTTVFYCLPTTHLLIIYVHIFMFCPCYPSVYNALSLIHLVKLSSLLRSYQTLTLVGKISSHTTMNLQGEPFSNVHTV